MPRQVDSELIVEKLVYMNFLARYIWGPSNRRNTLGLEIPHVLLG